MAENPLDSGFDKFNIPDISEVVFDNSTTTYNGAEVELLATNIPEGVDVEYSNNKRTNAGTQQASATFSYTYYEYAEEDPENPWDPETNPEPEPTEVTDIIDTLTADITISKAEINLTGISFPDSSVIYDGTPKSLAITGSLPSGVTVAYTGNNQTNVSVTTVTATLSGSNYNNKELTATLTITKATITGIDLVTLEDKSFVYDGSPKSLAIEGVLNNGATVSYTGNTLTNVGTSNVTALISAGNNYETKSLTAVITITKADINLTGISFPDSSITYDGTPKSLAITGSLPSGVTVSYTGNEQTEVGEYEVTATLSGSNYNNHILQATLTITPMAEESIPQPVEVNALPSIEFLKPGTEYYVHGTNIDAKNSTTRTDNIINIAISPLNAESAAIVPDNGVYTVSQFKDLSIFFGVASADPIADVIADYTVTLELTGPNDLSKTLFIEAAEINDGADYVLTGTTINANTIQNVTRPSFFQEETIAEPGEYTVVLTAVNNVDETTTDITVNIVVPEADESDLPAEYAEQILSIIAEENNFNYLRVGGLLSDSSEPLNTASFVAFMEAYLPEEAMFNANHYRLAEIYRAIVDGESEA